MSKVCSHAHINKDEEVLTDRVQKILSKWHEPPNRLKSKYTSHSYNEGTIDIELKSYQSMIRNHVTMCHLYLMDLC